MTPFTKAFAHTIAALAIVTVFLAGYITLLCSNVPWWPLVALFAIYALPILTLLFAVLTFELVYFMRLRRLGLEEN